MTREIIRQTREHLRYLHDLGIEEMVDPRRSAHSVPPEPLEARGEPRRTNDPGSPGSRESREEQGQEGRGLESLREQLGDCRRCRLAGDRTRIVFGAGNPKAELMFVGEAPGRDEDLQGEPFVGRAGQLLTRMIEAMGLSRETVYIGNVIKCRPPGNRNPEPDEIAVCKPFLLEQIRIIRPRVICALGKFSAQTLLETEVPISQLRGKVCHLPVLPDDPLAGIQVVPTFHPAYLLRNPAAKKPAWEDLQGIMKRLAQTVLP